MISLARPNLRLTVQRSLLQLLGRASQSVLFLSELITSSKAFHCVQFNVKAAMQDQARVRRAIKRLNKEALSSRPHTALREPALALREGYVAPGVTNQQAKRNKDFKLALATSAVAKEEEDEGVKKAVSEPMMVSCPDI